MANPITNLITFCNNSPTIYAAFGNRITGDRIPDGQLYPNARVIQAGDAQKYLLGKGRGGRKILLQIDIYAETIASAAHYVDNNVIDVHPAEQSSVPGDQPLPHGTSVHD